MTAFYNRMQQLATRLTKKYGTAVTVTRSGSIVMKGTAIFTNNAKDNLGTTPDSAGTTQDLKKCILNGDASGVPTVGDTLVQGTKSWRILEVEISRPADTTTHYTLVLQ